MYSRQPLPDAVRDALNVLGRPSSEWSEDHKNKAEADENTRAMQYEIDEAIYTLRAALDMPVPQNICDVCGARDSIYWSKNERQPKGSLRSDQMWCHKCQTIEPAHHWVTEVLPS